VIHRPQQPIPVPPPLEKQVPPPEKTPAPVPEPAPEPAPVEKPAVKLAMHEPFRGDYDTPAVAPPPVFSVIMPWYDVAHKGCERALESVIAQTFTDWELIIVNDASTDGGERVAEFYAARDPRIRVVHHAENQRVSVARNSGYWLARGDFFCHLDPDDEWLPEKLQRQFDALRANPYAGVSFGRVLVGAGAPRHNWNVERPIRDAWVAVRDRCLTPAQSVVVRRSLVQLAGGNRNTPELRRHAQDWDQWIRTFCVAEGAILDEPVYRLYWHPDSLTAQAMRKLSCR
jgi:glycosyltransferase involved in cell wall biosynthesis